MCVCAGKWEADALHFPGDGDEVGEGRGGLWAALGLGAAESPGCTEMGNTRIGPDLRRRRA